MWKVEPPSERALDVLAICIRSMQKPDLKSRLRAAAAEIGQAADRFESAADIHHTFALASEDFQVPGVKKTEMAWVYAQRFVNAVGGGNAIYSRMVLSPANGKCPACGERDATTLDHFLPKMSHSALAIDPLNLVPLCKDCNHTKGSAATTSAADEGIHPYFDDLADDAWLRAQIVETHPVSVVFDVVKPAEWSNITFQRAKAHFERFHLAPLYATHAARELRAVSRYMTDLLDKAGSAELQRHLACQAYSRKEDDPNSWAGAMYEALSDNDWFCAGGFINRTRAN